MVVRVTPRSRRPGLERDSSGGVRARVRAAPEHGNANTEAGELLAEALGVPKGAVRVVRGARSRTKIFSIQGLDDKKLQGRLQGL